MSGEETVDITSFAFGGEACGRMASGKVCFVRGAVPGETVKVKITQDKRSFARGTLVSVEKRSPDRIVPVCPVAPGNENASLPCCPGCSFLHVTYAAELAWKQKMLDRFILNVFPDAAMLPPCGADDRLHWRNRISLAVTPRGLAYFADDNVTPVHVTACPIAEKAINDLIPDAKEEALTHKLSGREKVFFRSTEDDGASYFFSSPGDVRKKRSSVIRESLGAFGKFTTFRESFFQVNRVMAEKLLSCVSEEVCKDLDFLADLYCGCGIFSIAAAERNPRLHTFGAEVDGGAVRCAKVNAEHHNVKDRCSFAVCDAAECLDRVKSRQAADGKSAVLVDPPRSGLSAEALNSILAAAPQKIVYVSCGPDTLARDLAVIRKSGAYRLVSCRLFDLFPSTAHFESVSVLEKT